MPVDDAGEVGSVWVVGRGGLLGAAVAAEERRRGASVFDASTVPWSSADSLRVLTTDLRAFLSGLSETREWRLYWCAGAGVTGSDESALEAERSTFEAFVAALEGALTPELARQGRFFLASSAAVYGGSAEPPFSIGSPPIPISPYAQLKLSMETIVSDFSRSSGTRVLIGRIANLYGRGQNLRKAQGLISQLINARRTGVPVRLFADPSTLRDYLNVDDAARMIVEDTVSARDPLRLSIIASGRAFSIADVLAVYREVFGEGALVEVKESAPGQILDLRLEPAERAWKLKSLADGMRELAGAPSSQGDVSQ
jgi:UDP-glucose 4-epimerase